MSFGSCQEVFKALFVARSSGEVRAVLDGVGDRPGLGLDKPFGPLNLFWHAFDDNLSNISTIGLATKAGRSLTERITNAIDALLEDKVRPGVATPKSAREAGERWFGRPSSGPDEGLFKWDYSTGGDDRRIHVVLHPSGVESAPTIDVLDSGIGLLPEDFASTILSLQRGNKIRKWYLIGAFGQGGASALGFCDYALVVSRHRDSPSVISFTVVRVLRLGEDYKEDTYAYLGTRGPGTGPSVPSCDLGSSPLRAFQPREGLRTPEFSRGTLVRHFSFRLSNLEKPLSPTPGNLYHYLHCSLFDPLLPFRLIDLRHPSRTRDEIVTGSRNRLMRLVAAGVSGAEEVTTAGSQIRHHRPMEFVVPHGTQDPVIGIEYWVAFNYRRKRKDSDDLVLRPHSNELFVQPNHPIVATLNGQNQGELTAQLLREIGLTMLSRHMVIHIDATNAGSQVRRELFSTNREGFKEGPVLTSLIGVLRKMLQEDEELARIERELSEKLLKHETDSASDAVKRQVRKLLLDAGFRPREEGPSQTTGTGPEVEHVTPKRKGGPGGKANPLRTLPFPEVTRFEIVRPKPSMEIHVGDNESILVETDADSEFDRRALVAIRAEPDALELAAKGLLRGGRIRWRLRPSGGAKAGDRGKIIATLTRPDGSQLRDETAYEVLPPIERRTKDARGRIPRFDIKPISPENEQWATIWPELTEEVGPGKQASVAYRPWPIGDKVVVYYSTIFSPFKAQADGLSARSKALLGLFRTNYEVWIAYHAILQHVGLSEKPQAEDEEKLSQLLEEERARVATMQVKQALQVAELMQKAIREAGD